MVKARYLKLLLIRHAQSLGNSQGVMEGQTSTELSELGHQQAQQLSTLLLQDLEKERTQSPAQPTPPIHIYSSSLKRADQTAQYLIEGLQPTPQTFQTYQTKALLEMHAGIFQALTWAQAQAKYPQLCAQLLSSMHWQPIPEAESLIAARSRAQSWTQHILQKHAPGDIVWAVSHEGFLQHLISVLLGCDRTWQLRITHTAIFEFWLSETAFTQVSPADRFNPEHWIIRKFNDSSHLHTSCR